MISKLSDWFFKTLKIQSFSVNRESSSFNRGMTMDTSTGFCIPAKLINLVYSGLDFLTISPPIREIIKPKNKEKII